MLKSSTEQFRKKKQSSQGQSVYAPFSVPSHHNECATAPTQSTLLILALLELMKRTSVTFPEHKMGACDRAVRKQSGSTAGRQHREGHSGCLETSVQQFGVQEPPMTSGSTFRQLLYGELPPPRCSSQAILLLTTVGLL